MILNNYLHLKYNYFLKNDNFKIPPRDCADIALGLHPAKLEHKRTIFSTKNLARRGGSRYLTLLQMLWLIARKGQERSTSPIPPCREDHPGTRPWVCGGVVQIFLAMKHHS